MENTQEFRHYNQRFINFLLVVDAFSDFIWTRPLKSRSAIELTSAFRDIVEKSGRHPQMLVVDQGMEFLSTNFQNYLASINVFLHTAIGDHKAGIAENAGKLVKRRLYRYRHLYETMVWAPTPLKDATQAENRRYLEILRKSPAEVTISDTHDIFENRFGKLLQMKWEKAGFYVGEVVRLKLKKTKAFEKGFTENYSTELYKVLRVIKGPPVYRYKLESLSGYPISNSYYAQELLPFYNV